MGGGGGRDHFHHGAANLVHGDAGAEGLVDADLLGDLAGLEAILGVLDGVEARRQQAGDELARGIRGVGAHALQGGGGEADDDAGQRRASGVNHGARDVRGLRALRIQSCPAQGDEGRDAAQAVVQEMHSILQKVGTCGWGGPEGKKQILNPGVAQDHRREWVWLLMTGLKTVEKILETGE